MYEIFNLGERNKKSSWSHKLRMFKKRTQEKARMVLVEGSPGIGKTTFCLKIANDWARETIPKKHDFPVFKLILLLKCRDMDGDVVQAIEDQLLPEDIAEKKKKVLMKYVMDEKNKGKILMILDGLDELPQIAEQFVDKLLGRKVLSHCSILVTSRQEKGIEVRQVYDFDSLLQINGFTIADASEYIRRHFKNVDSEDVLKGERLIRDIKENVFLHALRNNPLNLLLLCVVFEDFEGDLPSNRSELYQIICRCLLRRFCSKNNLEVQRDDRALENQFEASTLVLGGLAWKCLLEDRPCFLEEELDKLEKSITNGKGFSVVKLGFVFMEASFKKLNPRHEYHFVHRTFQEYLAAAYLALKIMKDKINVFDDFQLGKRDITRKYRQVFLFLAGILGKDGTMFFKQVGELLNKNWNWQSPEEEDCEFLTELLNESGAADELTKVIWPCIPLPLSLELSLRDGHALKFVRYAHKASSPVNLTKLTLTDAHTLTEDSASDVQGILVNNEALKDLFISANEVTSLLEINLLKCFSASNLSLSAFTLTIFGNMTNCLASALSEGLSGETALESLAVIVHGSVSNRGADLLVKSVQENRTLHSLTFKVFGDVPGHWKAVVDKIHLLAAKKSWKTLMLHPNVQGKLENASFSLLDPISTDALVEKNLTINIWGELSICNVETLGDHSQKGWKLSSLTLNVHSRVSNGVAECLVKFFSNNNVSSLLTINLWGEITSSGRTAFHRLRAECQVQSFILNMHGLVTEDSGCPSARNILSTSLVLPKDVSELSELSLISKSLTELNLLVFDDANTNEIGRHTVTDRLVESTSLSTTISSKTVFIDAKAEGWGYILGNSLAKNKSLTTLSLTICKSACKGQNLDHFLETGLAKNTSLTAFSLTVHIHVLTRGIWKFVLDGGLAKNKSLTTFSLTVHNHGVTGGDWEHGLGDGLAGNRSLTTFSLTVHNYSDMNEGWSLGLSNGLARNSSLTTFSLTVHNHGVTGGDWEHGLGDGLAGNRSLTTFSLTVHNYSDMSEGWSLGLSNGLAKNSSLRTFSLTVHEHAVYTGVDWGRNLGDGLAKNKSLNTLNLEVHNYTDTTEEWGDGLAEGLANNVSIATVRLSFHNHSSKNRNLEYDVLKRLVEIKSLRSLSLSVSLYGEDNVY